MRNVNQQLSVLRPPVILSGARVVAQPLRITVKQKMGARSVLGIPSLPDHLREDLTLPSN